VFVHMKIRRTADNDSRTMKLSLGFYSGIFLAINIEKIKYPTPFYCKEKCAFCLQSYMSNKISLVYRVFRNMWHNSRNDFLIFREKYFILA
jgi:hypothetical protein